MALPKKADIAHIIRAAAAVTQCKRFVLVGTGAVIVVIKTPPAFLMQTREIDIYPTDRDNPDAMADLIDGSLGEGSQFDRTFGYYADGVSHLTACPPVIGSNAPLSCRCPAPRMSTWFVPQRAISLYRSSALGERKTSYGSAKPCCMALPTSKP